MSGKGSKPRPFSVDKTTFDSNWERIFGKANKGTDRDRQSDGDESGSEQTRGEVADDSGTDSTARMDD